MPINFIIVEKGNPSNPAEPKKFYGAAKAEGEVTFRSLSREIAEGSTTTSDTDVLAVLNDLNRCLVKHLSKGRIVRFGDFGSFQISISGEGAVTAEKYNSSYITKAKIQFRPGIDLKGMLKNLDYKKVK